MAAHRTSRLANSSFAAIFISHEGFPIWGSLFGSGGDTDVEALIPATGRHLAATIPTCRIKTLLALSAARGGNDRALWAAIPTPEEKQVFPSLLLVLDVFKARIIKPPAAVPLARADWVVWIAETYPGCYLVRLPGGATLPVPYNEMKWTAPSACPTELGRSGQAVDTDQPATTFAMAKAMEQQRRWRTAVLPSIRQNLRL